MSYHPSAATNNKMSVYLFMVFSPVYRVSLETFSYTAIVIINTKILKSSCLKFSHAIIKSYILFL